jgi:hypothetical protein
MFLFPEKKFAFDIISEARIEKRPSMEEADPVLKVSKKVVRLWCKCFLLCIILCDKFVIVKFDDFVFATMLPMVKLKTFREALILCLLLTATFIH